MQETQKCHAAKYRKKRKGGRDGGRKEGNQDCYLISTKSKYDVLLEHSSECERPKGNPDFPFYSHTQGEHGS